MYVKNLTTHSMFLLKKTLYGLKQWPRGFARVMIAMEYRQNHGDYTIFIKNATFRGVTTLLVYVDNIIMTRNNDKKETLSKLVLG